MPGEEMHQIGADGARRAKEWLDATTRVIGSWTVEDDVKSGKLSFAWPHGGQEFSFDVGGLLSGDEFDKHSFLAECKKYSVVGNQPTHYEDWLAKCYVARQVEPKASEQFMFITWHPFGLNNWPKMATAAFVEKALRLERNAARVFGTTVAEEVDAMINHDLVADVASRVWVIVLSDKQERLVISREDRGRLVMWRVTSGAL